MREANTDAELDDRIYKLGDFGRIMNIAKRTLRRFHAVVDREKIIYPHLCRRKTDRPAFLGGKTRLAA